MAYIFEKHTQNVCDHNKDWDILGTGRQPNVGAKGKYYNAYYCQRCKKVYYENCHFRELIKVFYSRKGTVEHLKYIVEEGV